nr:fiber protein [uncultured Mediterranean phage uvMED]BAR23551.1 fiber protein [uncultured Mediterranean phage uvMED]
MAQSTDYSIANQSGANFRSELNTILAAIVSHNSGSTEPSGTKYAYMPWFDTGSTPPVYKIRNAANDGWITVAEVTTNFGLVSASGATFTGDITLNARSDVRFADADSSNYVALEAPATISSNYTLTLPAADGSANQALKTDGSGALGFASYLLLSETTNGQSVTGGVRSNIVTLTDAANIAYDMDDGNNATVTLAGNRTLDNPSNITVGQSGSIFIVQDGTGSRTLSFGNAFDFAGGTAPTLTTTASAVDRIDYVVRTTSSIHCNFVANFS